MAAKAEVEIRGLMRLHELSELEQSFVELSALKRKGPLQNAEQIKYEKCLKAIEEEDRRRRTLFDLIKEGDNLSDYPGILAKVRIGYDTATKEEPDAYEMYVFPSVITKEYVEYPIFMWFRVDLQGKILKKVVKNTRC
jgi:hypothetical protein